MVPSWRGGVRRCYAVGLLLAVAVTACSPAPSRRPVDGGATSPPSATAPPSAAASDNAGATESPVVIVDPTPTEVAPRPTSIPKPRIRTDAVRPPRWLGTRVLPRRPDGWGERQPTPPALRNRRFFTPDHLPPPRTRRFASVIEPVPRHVVKRSTWRRDCPLPLSELRYATVSIWGFDDRPHTGEMIVNAAAAEDLVGVFRTLYRARFPIEEMRVRRAGEIDLPPTGDINNTDVFDCRPATGGSHWSQHAYGLAIDINPFHNPYLKGDLVVPELAEAYLDRGWDRPGMIQPGDVVTQAFAEIGWGWGGNWSSLKDWQHFSSNGH